MIQRFATDEHAKNYPVEAASAREIIKRVRAEVAQKMNERENDMKESKNSSDFIDALRDIFAESKTEYDVLQNKVTIAEAKMNLAREEMRGSGNDGQMAQLRFDVAQSEFKLAESARRSEYKAMISGHETKVKELRERFAAFLDAHYAVSPDRLDANTMALLNAGICTAADLARLADRHANNPTMLRILGARAKEVRAGKISDADRAACLAVMAAADAAKDGSRELAIFDSAVSAATYGLAEDYRHATNMAKHIPGWFDSFCDQIKNLHNIPAAE